VEIRVSGQEYENREIEKIYDQIMLDINDGKYQNISGKRIPNDAFRISIHDTPIVNIDMKMLQQDLVFTFQKIDDYASIHNRRTIKEILDISENSQSNAVTSFKA